MSDTLVIYNELRNGGEWLASARTWMQSNVRRGDTLTWGSDTRVELPFRKLEDLALTVAIAAVNEERKRVRILEMKQHERSNTSSV